jgi:4-hydroxybenzoate polyprenyltransferase
MTIFHLLRPRDWIKNVLVFIPLIFWQGLRDPVMVGKVTLGFVFFCWLASSGYVFNDWNDRERDRLHPVKGLRPLASGMLSPQQALLAGVWLAAMAMVGMMMLGQGVTLVAGGYLVLSMGYSLFFKHQPGLDALVVTGLYLLRVEGGAEIMGGHATPWILICIAALALPIALAKRQAEQNKTFFYKFLEEKPDLYTALFVAAFLLYALFSISGEAMDLAGGSGLVVTLPFVAWALALLQGAQQQGKLSNPVGFFFSSGPLIYAALGWGFTCMLTIYGPL